MERVLLVAAGGLARETLASIRQTGDASVVGFLDDDPDQEGRVIDGVKVLGSLQRGIGGSEKLLVCAGPGAVREAIVARLSTWGVTSDAYATHVHPSVWHEPGLRIGHGSILLAGCVLTAAVAIGNHVVAMPHVTLTHDVHVADFATFAAGVSLGGGVCVGRAAYLGMNATVRQGLRVGERSMLGMGAVLTRDLPDGQTWVGNPAGPLARPAMRIKETEESCVN